MLHQPADQGRGTIPDLIVRADELLRVRGDLEQILHTHTGQDVETLRCDTDTDRVLNAQAAVAYGLVDAVVAER